MIKILIKMPTVCVNKESLFKAITRSFSDDEFDELCFKFGIELGEITSEFKMKELEQNVSDNNLSNETLYKIEVPANRLDLLCLEGLSSALRVFLGIDEQPNFNVVKPEKILKINVDNSVEKIRPFIISAILRNISFTEESFKSFIELQDKLHINFCRQRKFASMGTHDLDKIQGDVFYTAEYPQDIIFKALKQNEEMNAKDLLIHYEKNDFSKLGKYCHLLDSFEKFPVLRDSKGNVLCLPPIVNSEFSKISIETKNVFIDVTAIDKTKASLVLNILVTMFSCYCKDKFSIELVEIINNNGSEFYPKLEYNEFIADVNYLSSLSGTNLNDSEEICNILKKMCLKAKIKDEGKIQIVVPPTRSDIIQVCDVAEDLAIGFGYDNIKKLKPDTICNGYQQPINKLSELFRHELAYLGYIEALTFGLISKKDSIDNMLENSEKVKEFVQIYKPKTSTFELFRNNLIPSMLKVIEKNQMSSLPIKSFEITDVVILDNNSETGAINRRRLCLAYVDHTSGFEKVQGIIDHLFENRIGLVFGKDYHLQPSDNKAFFPDRQAYISLRGKNIGIIGIIHPDVNKNFGKIPYPITMAEIDIEFVFDLIKNKQL